MPSKRKRKSVANKRYSNGKSGKNRRRYYVLAALIMIIAFVLLYLFNRPSLWDKEGKLSLVVGGVGDVSVYVFNPSSEEITKIVIPQNTQVEVSRELGTWKTGSLWQLGVNEKLGGVVLAETLIKNFHLPINAWASDQANSYYEGELVGITKATVMTTRTNLSVIDRIRLALFSAGIKNFKKETINLENIGILEKTNLEDGSEGFIITRELPQKVKAHFSDELISGEGLRVVIYDHTGNREGYKQVGGVLETLGAKVASVIRKDEQDFDCVVSANDDHALNLVSGVFACDIEDGQVNGSFDIEIKIGRVFSDRY